MQFKKNRALLAAVLAAAMASSALMTCTASAAGSRKEEEAYGDETYAQRFLSLYDDVVTNGQENGYLSSKNTVSGGFGIPYHAVEELIVEAPDYGHETTSEAMSYIVWIAAMQIRHDEEVCARLCRGIRTGGMNRCRLRKHQLLAVERKVTVNLIR